MTAEYKNEKIPTVKYKGTVKLHGTNIGINKDGFWSRGLQPITIDCDHMYFAQKMSHVDMSKLFTNLGKNAMIFGEWCGQGIQKGVGINKIPPIFVIFAAFDNNKWVDISVIESMPDDRIFKITDFPTYEIEIDFEHPENAQEKLGELTMMVENECPVAKEFGISGIGEGIVWRPADYSMDSRYWFKIKGDKHKTTKTRTLAPIDIEIMERKDELVSALLTESRLDQGIDHLKNNLHLDIEMKNIGKYISWIYDDIVKEDTDIIIANGFTPKELGKPIANQSKKYFISVTTGL